MILRKIKIKLAELNASRNLSFYENAAAFGNQRCE